ncbi:LysE family transporter [Dactylosporangium sp. NPDC000244]|uniref:LysE family translocator n=1 Tax=Dactylosporangium sp. NPDC000244 TaxID=3154365 RepID=UPI00332600FE
MRAHVAAFLVAILPLIAMPGASLTLLTRPPLPPVNRGRRPAYLQALLGNVLNPKAAAIFLTLVPQFLDPAAAILPQILVLATAQAALITVWLLGWTVLIGRARQSLRSATASTIVRRIAAAVLVGLGIRTVVA